MDTIQMRWFFRVISITYGCDEICERGTYGVCGGCAVSGVQQQQPQQEMPPPARAVRASQGIPGD
jgi:hypothetical protein